MRAVNESARDKEHAVSLDNTLPTVVLLQRYHCEMRDGRFACEGGPERCPALTVPVREEGRIVRSK